MSAPRSPRPVSGRAAAGQAEGRGWKKYWPLALGLLLPLLLLAILYGLGKTGLAQREAKGKLRVDDWQAANLTALEAEIEAYKRALTRPPCELPERLGPVPAAPAEEPASLAGREPVSPSTPEAGENLTDLVERATVLVLVDAPDELTRGTGFFIAPNIILTNRHVVDDLRKNRGGTKALVTSKALGGAVGARLLRSTNPDELRDYAFLEISPPPGRNPAVLALSPEIRRADHISSWGYPALFIKTDPQMAALMAGDISAVPEVVYSEGVVSVVQDLDGLPLINHTAEVSHGNSGGPLVNGRGEVVGINTMIRVDEQSNRQVNIALGSRDIIDYAAGLGLTLAVRSTGAD